MNTEIELLTSTTFGDKQFTRKQLYEIQSTVKRFPGLSRTELARTLCEHLNLMTHTGKHRLKLCLNALDEMEAIELIALPAKIIQKTKSKPKKIKWTKRTATQATISTPLDAFTAIDVEPVQDTDEVILFNEFIDRHHYLGYKRPIGNHLRYFIRAKTTQGSQIVGCILFAFATQTLACRDQWIGWNDKQHQKHLPLIINNTRFLIFPWVKVKNLASKALSMTTKRVASDWLKYHGLHPVLVETFVDTARFNGTCYKAANWSAIGYSAGKKGSKNVKEVTPKAVFVYPLYPEYSMVLTQNRMWTKPVKKRKQPALSNYASEPVKLNSNDPFIHLWQHIIGVISDVANEFDAKWQQRRRVINTLLIMLFIFRLVFSKNKQGYTTTIVELWAQCRTMDIALPQPKPVAASAFCKARKKLDAKVFKILNSRIIAAHEGSDCPLWCGRRLFAVDGMKINLPRPLRYPHTDYRLPSDNAKYPQGLVSCLYQLKTQIPYDFDLSAHMNERHMAEAHLKTLKEGDLVVYDRGYFSYAMLYAHHCKGVDVVFRLKRKAGKEIDAFMDNNEETDSIITLEVDPKRQREVMEQYPDIEFKAIPIRLIKYKVEGTDYVLGTTLLDKKHYSLSAFPDLYHARWGVEELYKISKQLMQVNEFHAQTEQGVKQELFAHFVLLTLNRILVNHTETQLNPDNKNDNTKVNRRYFKVNVKNALITMARHMEELFLQQVKLTCNTLNTVIDALGFCRQSTRPGRKYPRVSMKPVNKWRASKT